MRYSEMQCLCNMMRQTSEVSPQWQIKVVQKNPHWTLFDIGRKWECDIDLTWEKNGHKRQSN